MPSGILKKSSSCKKVSDPTEIPKNKNKKAGKQHDVERTAVNTAVKNRFIFFIIFLEKCSCI